MISIEELYNIYRLNPNIQTDSRKIKEGDLYWALKGERFNGNDFAIQALCNGAKLAIVDDINLKHSGLIYVSNTLETLHNLALYHRKRFSIPFIAITGSNGKTTTKELVYSVLSSSFKTCATEGNLNNHIGIPLTILKIPDDTQIAIIEMGANHQKEISNYCSFCLPNLGIITNIGKAHMGFFDGIKGVKKAKKELFDFLEKSENSCVFVNRDDEYLSCISSEIKNVFYYGMISNADVVGKIVNCNPFIETDIYVGKQKFSISTKLVGDYNVMNVLCAVSVGIYFKIDIDKIISSIENYIPNNARSQYMVVKSNKVILDAYPTSMTLAIKNFASLPFPSENKILLLGEMKELGKDSLYEHNILLELICKYKWGKVFLVGNEFKKLIRKESFNFFDNVDQLKDFIKEGEITNSYLLIKGSRSTMMEKILDFI